jgi:protein-disulfide isomerase
MESLQEPEEKNSEFIVIKRSLLVTIGVGLLTFLVGGALGYFLAITGYNRGADETLAAIGAAQPAAQAAAQPTDPPAFVANVTEAGNPSIGPANAPVVIVEFSDFRCPYCKRFHDETLPALLTKYGDQIRLVYRDFPIVGGEVAAEAADCANAQGKYWDYGNALFADQQAYNTNDDYIALAAQLGLDQTQFSDCLNNGTYKDEVSTDYNAALEYGVNGTPTFFINGQRLVGAQPQSVFEQAIDQALTNK